MHRIQYQKQDGSMDEAAVFNIHEGRPQRETGRVRIVSKYIGSNITAF